MAKKTSTPNPDDFENDGKTIDERLEDAELEVDPVDLSPFGKYRVLQDNTLIDYPGYSAIANRDDEVEIPVSVATRLTNADVRLTRLDPVEA